ncbi:FkbM family methyltransferase [Neorhizobium sp. JUb45]|uniref:FkbM family methyltransferase n=1 Tax=unclassified Neorhizobium TaxID=2629175 RepID=UPI00104CEB7B|nr:FkbM family methyltransferase [Neorhizobium sp. JUb45]TCR06557.1 FkbM family methyltransferase [Neorhizobium sp. JUb45]
MNFNLLKALIFPSKRDRYLTRLWKQRGTIDPGLVVTGCISAGIDTLGFRYLGKYPVLLDVHGQSIPESVLRHGHFQFDLFETLADIYPRRDVRFINIGANIGTSCLNAYEAGFRDIVAFEPVGRNFHLLTHNLASIEADIRHQAVGDQNGRLTIHLNRGSTGMNSFMRDYGDGGEEVEIVRLDDAIEPVPSFLWIDTEGYEVHVLRGAERHLAESVQGLCVEVTPSILKAEGLAALEEILKRHFTRFYLNTGPVQELDIKRLTADGKHGKQIDLIALK